MRLKVSIVRLKVKGLRRVLNSPEQVFAVVRLDLFGSPKSPEDAIKVKEILPSRDDAELEVRRLNESQPDGKVRYFVSTTRFYPNGRRLE